jgi:carbohydrate kinase (thermoresistant glucokinase family)
MMIIILMGVSGSGKTTVGERLAQALGWRFYDGDQFHPPANVAKMQQGMPLTDEDRWPWLQALRAHIETCMHQGVSAVLTCSALKQAYRECLVIDEAEVKLVYLKGDYDLIHERLAQRRGHFMPPGLLASQFAALEEPERGVVVNIVHPPETIVALIREQLGV